MKIEYIINSDQPIHLHDFLIMNHYSTPLIKKMINSKDSFIVNERVVDINFLLLRDDYLSVNLPSEDIHQGMIEVLPEVLYEDEYLMVINKPIHIPVIGTRAHIDYNLSLMIAYYYHLNKIMSGVHLVNRLDKETEGLLLVAKHAYIHHLFSSNLYSIKRKYFGIIEGRLDNKDGIIDLPIKKDQSHHVKRMVSLQGKKAVTRYQEIADNDDFSLLDLELETGRTHQIRVHLSYLNHALVGDPLYGNELYDRMYLQSYYLSFNHPITKQELTITLPKERQLSLLSLQLKLVYLPNTKIELYQHDLLYHISSDTVLLGEYLKVNQDDIVVDVGTNNGALLIYASLFQPKLLIGIDINETALRIAAINLKKNGVENYELIADKVQNVRLDNIDVIVSNPPYFLSQPKLKNNSPRFQSKHEETLALSELFIFAKTSLKHNGRFYLINRASRLAEIKLLATQFGFDISDKWVEEITTNSSKRRILLTLIKKTT